MLFHDLIAIFARVLIYVGSIGAAGSILLILTLRAQGYFAYMLKRQSLVSSFILILTLPVSYFSFQLSVAGGDIAIAFSEGFRDIYFQTSQGVLALSRLASAAILIILVLLTQRRAFYVYFSTIPALVLISLFVFEGHSTSFGLRWISAALVITHLVVVHWWFAVLAPLAHTIPAEQQEYAHRFGSQAIVAVPLMVGAGLIFLAILAEWEWPEFQEYFQRFALKMIIFSAVIMMAALNKLYFTNGPGLKWSLRLETFFGVVLLISTAFLVRTSP